MRSQPRKITAVLMLLIFVMGLGAYCFNPKLMAHAYEHDRHTLSMLSGHDHPSQSGDPTPESMSDADHLLVHSVGHLQLPLIAATLISFGEPSGRMPPLLSHLLALPPAESEPPFRPPRISART